MVQAAVGLHPAQVSGQVESLAGIGRVLPEDCVRQVGPAPVTQRKERALDDDLADLVGRHRPAVVVDDGKLHVVDSVADRYLRRGYGQRVINEESPQDVGLGGAQPDVQQTGRGELTTKGVDVGQRYGLASQDDESKIG